MHYLVNHEWNIAANVNLIKNAIKLNKALVAIILVFRRKKWFLSSNFHKQKNNYVVTLYVIPQPRKHSKHGIQWYLKQANLSSKPFIKETTNLLPTRKLFLLSNPELSKSISLPFYFINTLLLQRYWDLNKLKIFLSSKHLSIE